MRFRFAIPRSGPFLPSVGSVILSSQRYKPLEPMPSRRPLFKSSSSSQNHLKSMWIIRFQNSSWRVQVKTCHEASVSEKKLFLSRNLKIAHSMSYRSFIKGSDWTRSRSASLLGDVLKSLPNMMPRNILYIFGLWPGSQTVC